ncbi:MAG: SpoIIE family protein phosphatase [Bacillota bacterium]|nr:SpoIIE family protein phosphatase [Bacillota bacterium]
MTNPMALSSYNLNCSKRTENEIKDGEKMSASTIAKTREINNQEFSAKTIKAIVMQLICFASGIIVARGAIFGSLAPFGASYIAAVPPKKVVASLAGTIVGYMLLSPSNSFRYVAAVIAVAAIRWTLNDIKRISKSKLFAPIIAFFPIMATGFVLLTIHSNNMPTLAMCLIEAMLAAVGAFFFSRSIDISVGSRSLTALNQQEIACLVMSGCIFILAFSGITVSSVSLGRIIAILIILLCARYGGIAGGCIAGIATGIIFSMASTDLTFISGAYAFGGLMAGLFAPTGKVGSAVTFILCNAVMVINSADPSMVQAALIEMVIASAIFMVLPKELGNTVAAIFAPAAGTNNSEGLRRSVIMRLDFASRALSDVTDSVNDVADKLQKFYTANVDSIYSKTIEDTCSRCGLKTFCWEHQKLKNSEVFTHVSSLLTKHGTVTEKEFTEAFQKKCCKPVEMVSSINRNFDAYKAGEAAERRVCEIRGVVAGQFAGLSQILGDMAEEFDNFERFDTEASQRIITVLKQAGLVPIDVSCRIDRFGRMAVEIETAETDRRELKNVKLQKEVAKACGRRFDPPMISEAPNRIRIQLSERPYFDVAIGSAQHVSGNGMLCGDCFDYFNDGNGHLITLISDGMGTGGRAAVDGNMATAIMVKLCKAGLSFDCALQVVNSALMVKSGDESLATLDLSSIDLFTGEVEFMKAGAPLTIIRKGEKIMRKDSPSLPAGILPGVRFSHDYEELDENDVVVMVSDGAISIGENWLEKMILSWKEGEPRDFAAEIVDEAVRRRNDGHDDDVTAIVMKMTKN